MKFSLSRFVHWSVLFFVFLIPFGTKKFLFDFPTPFRNFYTSEYSSAFLYGSDVLFLVCFLLLFFSKPLSLRREWLKENFDKFKAPLFFLALFLIFGALSLFSAGSFYFGVYSFGRLALGVLAALMIGAALKSNIARFKEIAVAISLAAVFQAIVGFLQFILGKSAGLWFLGETVFGPTTPGIAKISVNGMEFIRAYGTMPHANILAGFLILGLLSFFYLFLREGKFYRRALEAGGIFIVLTGLFLTFSRSGWITTAAATLLFIILEFLANKERRARVIYLTLLLFVICSLLFVSLGWAISSRAHFSAGEGPVSDRWNYNKIGAELILSHPLGVGIGNQLFYTYHSGLFDKYNVNSLGQWQPTHNLYLIMASEIGILGLLGFVGFIFSLLFGNPKSEALNTKSRFHRGSSTKSGRIQSTNSSNSKRFGYFPPKADPPSEENFGILRLFRISDLDIRISTIMLIALLFFGLFDHFLWDLQLGRLMLWMVIGILLGVSSKRK